MCLYAASKRLDFGQVSIRAAVSKSLTITNDLKQNILVTVDIGDCFELSRSTPLSQVIPPHTTAGFDITFCAERVYRFAQVLTYTVNGIHKHNVAITAEVRPSYILFVCCLYLYIVCADQCRCMESEDI